MGNRHKGLDDCCPCLPHLGRFAVEVSLNHRLVELGLSGPSDPPKVLSTSSRGEAHAVEIPRKADNRAKR